MIQRGKIYFVDLANGGDRSDSRPVLVLWIDAIDNLPLVITVVIGTECENAPEDDPTNVYVTAQESGLSKDIVFSCSQVRSIDPNCFPKQAAGKISNKVLIKIENAVRHCLGL